MTYMLMPGSEWVKDHLADPPINDVIHLTADTQTPIPGLRWAAAWWSRWPESGVHGHGDSQGAQPVYVAKMSATIDGRTYHARITQAETTAYVEVWGGGWDYAENIQTRDATAAMVDPALLGNRHPFPVVHVNILRMAAVVYARQHAARTGTPTAASNLQRRQPSLGAANDARQHGYRYDEAWTIAKDMASFSGAAVTRII